MKRLNLLFFAVAVLCAAAGIFYGARRMEPAASVPDGAAQLLAQTMPDARGKPTALAQWQGKPLIVNFWATWCAPCVEEMPELSALQQEISAQGIQILGIGVDSATNISEFSSKYRIAYPLYVAGMGGADLSRQFGNQSGGLPFTVLINADGKVRKTYLGRLKLQELRKDLASL